MQPQKNEIQICSNKHETGLVFFEVGIPNLLCECILGWRSVTYQLWVIVTLTSDLVLEHRAQSISFILFKIGIPNFGVWMHHGLMECRVLFTDHCDL